MARWLAIRRRNSHTRCYLKKAFSLVETIAITGASGFIGRHLLAKLVSRDDRRIKVLSRARKNDLRESKSGSSVEIVPGDVLDRKALRELIEPGSTVVNLVYLAEAGEAKNLEACTVLLAACKAAKVRRLIHCSTASVVGGVPDDVVTEKTVCQPVTGYASAKLKIELAIFAGALDSFEATILRPTAVFGAEGENLNKLARDLTSGDRMRNFLRSCLFGSRRMNLVYIDNVVASIIFLADCESNLGGEVFNVADAESALNNFSDVERILMRELGVPTYGFPKPRVPLSVLALLLKFRRRDIINPHCNFSSDKLLGLGFERPVSFETGLVEYANWFRQSRYHNSSAAI